MNTNDEKSQPESAATINHTNDTTKVSIIREELGIDLFELQFKGNKYYSTFKDSFVISMDCLKDLNVREMPVNIEIGIEFTDPSYWESSIEFEFPDFDIWRESDGKCRVGLSLGLDPRGANEQIMINLFHDLKREFILLHTEVNPKIEAEVECNLYYSIEIEGETIEKIIAKAKAFNDGINEEIKRVANNLPRFLADSLGLDKSLKIFDSLKNYVR
jgi:hypothetical protein